MTVKFVTSQQESFKSEKVNTDFENYFKQLYVLPISISSDESIKRFVKQIKQTFAGQNGPNEARGEKNFEIPTGSRSSFEESNHTFGDGVIPRSTDVYGNTPREETLIFKKYEEMRTDEIKRSASEEDKWSQYPPVHQKNTQVKARIPHRKEMSGNILHCKRIL